MTQLIKIVNNRSKLPLGAFLLVWVYVLYMLPNKYQLLHPQPVPRTMVDGFVNLNPYWVWIYISYYPYLMASYLLSKDEKNTNQVFYSFAVSATIGTLIFFLFPTSISRELYPLAEIDTWSAWTLSVIRVLDQSVNCAPSMHITFSTIAALTFLREKTWYRWPVATWALFIAYSTMATKQHYWWDVVAGFALGIFVFGFFDKAEYVETTERRGFAE